MYFLEVYIYNYIYLSIVLEGNFIMKEVTLITQVKYLPNFSFELFTNLLIIKVFGNKTSFAVSNIYTFT